MIRHNFKQILYFGSRLMVPDVPGWLATDADGAVFFFDTCPDIDLDQGVWKVDYCDSYELFHVGEILQEGQSWQDSLVMV